MKILIGADIVPTKSNQQYFENVQINRIIDKDLLEIINNADYRIFNLEVPLVDKETPIEKRGPNLIASTKSIAGLKQLGIDFLTLANNHILDQGEQGMWSTANLLDQVGIAYAGIGQTPDQAARPHIVEIKGKKLGIYCCAEHEFSIVSDKRAGANPFDPLESLDHITALKKQSDFVVCLYHGGKEHYRYPSPYLQKVCRKIVEKGADLVICQHTHCIGCEEKWQDGTIVYGQGNFLFDHSDSEYWQTSILIQVDMTSRMIQYIPIMKNGNGVRLAVGNDAQQIISEMQHRSKEIQQKDFVEKMYEGFAKSMIDVYISGDCLIMKNFIFRVLNKLCRYRISEKIIRKRLHQNRMLYINQYECEAHRELILKGLEVTEE